MDASGIAHTANPWQEKHIIPVSGFIDHSPG